MFLTSSGEQTTKLNKRECRFTLPNNRETVTAPRRTYSNQALLRRRRNGGMPPVTPSRPSQVVSLQRKCACGGSTKLRGGCTECKAEEGGVLQRKEASDREPSDVPPIVHDVLRSPGQPLDEATRAFMEPRFGYDFSQVRIHTDSKAAESASAVNALAYAVGSHLVFNNAQYQPNSSVGRKLLAHELTHAVQQSGNNTYSRSSLVIGTKDDQFESIADSVSDSIDRGFTIGHTITVDKKSNANGTIQRVAGADDAVEAVTLGAVLAWCVSGAIVTAGIDEVIQLGKWAWNRGKFYQNWCSTLFSALFGCVFGLASGAFEKMFLAEGLAITGSNIADWIIKKLILFGYTQLAGKIALGLAKHGCLDAQNKSVATLDDGGNSNQEVADQGEGNTTSSDTNSAVA